MNIGTFADWVAIGASIGIKAFFAVAVFMAFFAAIMGLLAIFGSITKEAEDGKEKRDRPRPY